MIKLHSRSHCIHPFLHGNLACQGLGLDDVVRRCAVRLGLGQYTNTPSRLMKHLPPLVSPKVFSTGLVAVVLVYANPDGHTPSPPAGWISWQKGPTCPDLCPHSYAVQPLFPLQIERQFASESMAVVWQCGGLLLLASTQWPRPSSI